MKKENLIKKWLDNELTQEELVEFQQLEEYNSFVKLSEKAQLFKAPNFNSEDAYKKVLPIIEEKRTHKSIMQRFRPIIQIAAILVAGIVVYSTFFINNITTVETLAIQKKTINLPDASIVELNAMSTLAFNENTWDKKREVSLNGEAFFKVAKGSQFGVNTSAGTVSVVGTQFNIKNRIDYFEVKCFEGKVTVTYKNEVISLPAGKTMRVINKNIFQDTTELLQPTWVDKFSSFESVPYFEVIAELERQYNIKVVVDNDMDMSVLYSGMFVHNNKDLAIKSIAIPFRMEYTIVNNVVTLKKFE